MNGRASVAGTARSARMNAAGIEATNVMMKKIPATNADFLAELIGPLPPSRFHEPAGGRVCRAQSAQSRTRYRQYSGKAFRNVALF